MHIENLISRAIPLYLGYGSGIAPTTNKEILINQYGAKTGEDIINIINNIINILNKTEINWNEYDLVSASDFAVSELIKSYPFLDEQAQNSLKWKFTFDWR